MNEEEQKPQQLRPDELCLTCGKDAEQFVDGDCPDFNPLMTASEPEPTEKVEHSVFVRADCGCRFQIVSALPLLNAGVLAMPDIDANVCDTHRARQEEALAKREEDAKRPQITGPDGRTIVRMRDR